MATLNLQAYSGLWYEVAKKNAWFETQCARSTAFYEVIPQGLSIVNSCYSQKNILISQIRGKATPTRNPLIFNVTFETGQTGKYQVLYTDYSHFSFVGNVETQYLSILSRNPTITDSERSLLTQLAKKYGFKNITFTA